MEKLMNCQKCNTQNPEGVNFCQQCGSPMPKLQEARSETTERFCNNCGHPNPVNANFCSGCGTSFSVVMPAPAAAPRPGSTFWASFGKTTAWVLGSLLLTLLVLNIWGVLNAFSPLYQDHTAEAEVLAIDFVREHYPELAGAERTAYIARIDGTDYYVVDFVLNESPHPPQGVRILVDRLLRAVFTYELIRG